jgi:hypothetical protein
VLPQMPPEPPPDFVAFVARRLPDARAQAARLTGGRHADEVYPGALADVATWWRWRRMWPVDPDRLLARRLAVQGSRWRAEQIYEVDVRPVRPEPRRLPRIASVALRKAGLLAPTARPHEQPAAEAAIAWATAYRRYVWRRWTRTLLSVALVLVVLAQSLPEPPT